MVITAVKDGIEDWRRTVLDNELNNSPVHKLLYWENVNVSDDNISLWRRMKKATSHTITRLFRLWQEKKRRKSPGKGYTERALDAPAMSVDTSRRGSFMSSKSRGDEEGIPMTPVPSPIPNGSSPKNKTAQESRKRANTAFSYEGGVLDGIEALSPNWHSSKPETKDNSDGSIINPFKEAPRKARFMKDCWKSLHVGDFVRLYNNDQVPADIVVLATSDPDGACYVETKNLDGETNLKVRQALRCGREVHHAHDCERSEFVLESEPPHSNLYAYSGAVKWTQKDPKNSYDPGTERTEAVSINNLLLRGCNLRNTEWIVGIVAFTGQDTKIMINAGVTPSKRSRISRELNWNIAGNFGILFIMCLVSGLANGLSFANTHQSWAFFEFGQVGGSAIVTGIVTFWAAVILYQNLVPISLYVSLEIIKVCQAFFIYSDTYMYYDRLDYPCTPKSWNISDDVGQVEYIFSDKTGTLTQNVMEFKKCTINGVAYGEAYTEALAGMQRRQGIDIEAEAAKANKQISLDRARMISTLREINDNPYLHDDELPFVAQDLAEDLTGAAGEGLKNAGENFMLALALCHTVITELTPGDPPKLEFKAQSPDEAALVATARDCGFTVLGRNEDKMMINVQGQERQYTVLNTLEFNSTRKRMSAIIRMPDGRIMLFCKGADSIIYSRLKRGEQAQLRKATAEHLEMFAREGLRTLCIAQKEITEDEYAVWNKEHDLAAAAIADREDKLEAVADAMERDLSLLGGTAIEDRLQDGVPDTIALLGTAGIKLWVLTGDKVETAINIGFACNLLGNDMDLIVLQFETDDLEAVNAELSKHLRTFGMTGSDEELKKAKTDHRPPAPTHAIIIDGDSLKLTLDDSVRQKFLLLCKQCKAVLCCRVSPSQKAAVVQMVKRGLDVMTLSIGDGANDVAMIQQADIGVGIAGEEGRQAVMSADYGIGQFRFLQRLVLVHGRWSYRRLGECIANFFYKVQCRLPIKSVANECQNMVWTFALYWYQIYDNADCAYLFEYTYILLFNVVFTSLPVVFMGILDQDVSDKVSLAVPQLYARGIERKDWTNTKFWLYMADAAYQSLICFFMPYLLFAPAVSVTASGLDINETTRIGIFVASAAIICVNSYILMNSNRWDWLLILLTVISTVIPWFWTGIYTCFTSSGQFYRAGAEVYGSLSYWATLLLTVIIALLPRFAIKSFQKMFMPYDVDIVREQWRRGEFDYLNDLPPDASPGAMAAGKKDASSGGSNGKQHQHLDDETRPIYAPSVAPTTTTYTHNRSVNGSDSTEFSRQRLSMERQPRPVSFIDPPLDSRPVSMSRPLSMADRPRPSFDRVRTSMEVCRPSFEASNDFTSASRLMRMESAHDASSPTSLKTPRGPSNLR